MFVIKQREEKIIKNIKKQLKYQKNSQSTNINPVDLYNPITR